MTETQWFDAEWTDGELREQYRDARQGKTRREHAFHVYWHRRFTRDSESVPDAVIDDLLDFKAWQGGFWTIVSTFAGRLAQQERLTTPVCERLLSVLPPDAWAVPRIKSLLVYRDSALNPAEKFRQFAALGTYWFAETVIKSASGEEIEEIKQVAEAAPLYKFAKKRLLQMVNAAFYEKRLLFFMLILVVATIGAGSARAQSPTPFVQNGGFEAATEHWSIPPGDATIDGAGAFAGQSSLRVTRTDAGAYRVVTQKLPCEPGGIYAYRAQVKGLNLVSLPDAEQNRGAGVFLEFYDARGEWLGGDYPPGEVGTFAWKEVGGRVRVPLNARSIALGLYLRRGTTGTAWFDAVDARFISPALTWFVENPGYRGVVQSGDASDWRAQLVVNRAASAGSVRVRSRIMTGKQILSECIVPVPPRAPDAPLMTTITLAQPVGKRTAQPRADLVWRAELLSETGGVLGTQTLSVRVTRTPPKVSIGRGGVWQVGQKPFFPLGIYLIRASETSDGDLARIAGAGFNTVLCYAYGAGNEPRAFLDRAQRYGLKVIDNLKDFHEFSDEFPRRLAKKGHELTAEYVAALRDHPALLAWYINDETGMEREAELRAMYRQVAALDPEHPAIHVLTQWGTLDNFWDMTDVLGVDPYPIPRFSFGIVPQWTRAAVAAARGAKSPLTVTQAFSYATYPPALPNARAPTEGEIRCMNVLALCAGARGLLFYSYGDLLMHDSKRGQERDAARFAREWPGVQSVATQMSDLLPVLTGGKEVALAADTTDLDLHFRALRYRDRTYLLVANAADYPAVLTLPPLRDALRVQWGDLSLRRGARIAVDVPAHGSGLLVWESR